MSDITIKVGDRLYFDDDEDSGEYIVIRIDAERDNCWLLGENIGDDERTVEQELPLSFANRLHKL
jgi:bifunctional DNA-binding transcriptional regulator/antitoxin component of YhaV-PrlF toxin-antitoxin module